MIANLGIVLVGFFFLERVDAVESVSILMDVSLASILVVEMKIFNGTTKLLFTKHNVH